MQNPPAILCLLYQHVLGYPVRGVSAWHELWTLSKVRTGGGPLLIFCSAGLASPLHSSGKKGLDSSSFRVSVVSFIAICC